MIVIANVSYLDFVFVVLFVFFCKLWLNTHCIIMTTKKHHSRTHHRNAFVFEGKGYDLSSKVWNHLAPNYHIKAFARRIGHHVRIGHDKSLPIYNFLSRIQSIGLNDDDWSKNFEEIERNMIRMAATQIIWHMEFGALDFAKTQPNDVGEAIDHILYNVMDPLIRALLAENYKRLETPPETNKLKEFHEILFQNAAVLCLIFNHMYELRKPMQDAYKSKDFSGVAQLIMNEAVENIKSGKMAPWQYGMVTPWWVPIVIVFGVMFAVGLVTVAVVNTLRLTGSI